MLHQRKAGSHTTAKICIRGGKGFCAYSENFLLLLLLPKRACGQLICQQWGGLLARPLDKENELDSAFSFKALLSHGVAKALNEESALEICKSEGLSGVPPS